MARPSFIIIPRTEANVKMTFCYEQPQVVSPSGSASISPPSLLSSSTTSHPSTSTSQSSQAQSTSKSQSDFPPAHSHAHPSQPPVTPQRGRTRYPNNLTRDPNRVPLHRRGTSRTYERLEDLLKEAGYKETRVFTPETDRFDNEGKGKNREEVSMTRGGVGAVVGFLTGLISSGQSQGHEDKEDEGSEDDRDTMAVQNRDMTNGWSATSTGSPIARKLTLNSPLRQTSFPSTDSQETIRQPILTMARSPSPVPTPSGYSSSSSSRPSSRLRHYDSSAHPSLSHHHDQHIHSHTAPKHQLSFTQLSQDVPHHNPVRPQPSLPSHMQTYTQASAARNYLRHMASTPDIPRRKLTPQYSAVARRSTTRTDTDIESDAEHNGRPPMPQSWLEVVAKAILGAPGSHIGGPSTSGMAGGKNGTLLERSRSSISTKSAPPSHSSRGIRSLSQSHNPSAAPSRSNTLRGRRTNRRLPQDVTNINASGMPEARPSLLMVNCTNLMSAKASSSVGLVVKTNVVCRSAPASRETSAARMGRDVSLQRSEAGYKIGSKSRGSFLGGGRKGGRKRKDTVPSLSTRVEDLDFDVWGRPQRPPFDSNDGNYSVDEDGESDDEGELDLARLLVNPKRQHSIQSLRKHLDRDHRAAVTATLFPRPSSSLAQSYPHTASAASSLERGRKPRIAGMMATWVPEDMDNGGEIDRHGEVLDRMTAGSGMSGKLRGNLTSHSKGVEGEDDEVDRRDLRMLVGSSAARNDLSTKRSRRGLPKGWSEDSYAR